MTTLLAVPLAMLLDRVFGEPSSFHPLIGFGSFVNRLETTFNNGQIRIARGGIAWAIAVIPITFIVYLLDQWLGGLWLSIIMGWLAIGWQSLRKHGLAVHDALSKKHIDDARLKTSYLVSRDTSELDESDLSKATIESLLENTSDAIIAPLFWLILLGAPGVVLYRLSNTLDAMWGYHSEQFELFGKFSARIDDGLNIIPARITSLLFLILGNSKQAWRAWKTQGTIWYSPNAGIVMASGAGALNLKLGGDAIYHDKSKPRPELGAGGSAQQEDIKRAVTLMDKSTYGFAIITMLLYTPHLFLYFLGR